MNEEYFYIAVCENNDNGIRRGRATSFDFYFAERFVLTLEAVDMIDGEAILSDDKSIIIYNIRIAHAGVHEWCGSMTFNEYRVHVSYALALLNKLFENNKRWQWVGGCSELYCKWLTGQPVTSMDFGISENIGQAFIDINQLSMFTTNNERL